MTLEKLLEGYESFSKALQEVSGLEVSVSSTKTSSAADIAALEKTLGVRVPDDLKMFWTRGFHNIDICEGDDVIGACKFVDAKGALGQAKIALGMVDDAEPDAARWLQHGIPFQEEEEYCLVDASKTGEGRIYQMRFDGDLVTTAIAPSFTKFFEAWLASGCFSYGNADAKVFARYWKKVGKLVPIAIAPEKNPWLKHVGRWYENKKFPA